MVNLAGEIEMIRKLSRRPLSQGALRPDPCYLGGVPPLRIESKSDPTVSLKIYLVTLPFSTSSPLVLPFSLLHHPFLVVLIARTLSN